MATIPARIIERLVSGLRRFQPILSAAKSRDAGESDTCTIVTDMLSDLFGYDKYTEVTSEFAIKSTYCDLAIKLDGKLQLLIEVKAIGIDLKELHSRQAVDYAANQGVEWVVLTNGVTWRIYRIVFAQPISQELVFESDLLSLNPKNKTEVSNLFLLAKEGQGKSVLDEYHARRQAMSRYFLGALILSDPVLEVLRRELRKVSPGIRIETAELYEALCSEVLKRDVAEGEKADETRKKINRIQSKAQAQRLRPKSDSAKITDELPLPSTVVAMKTDGEQS